MGVVYKLKDEIVDFIVQQKKINADLSCRHFVSLVKEKFHIDVSKSSVNKILKDSSLSSPVGRRASAREPRKKRFQIPEKKKKELFPADKLKIPSSSGRAPVRESAAKPASRPAKQAQQDSPSRSGDVPSIPHISDDIFCDGLGAIFLKAAEWEISEYPILGKFLKKYVKGLSLTDMETIGEILLYMPLFGIRSIQEIDGYRGKGLWLLHNVREAIDAATLDNVLKGAEDMQGFLLDLSIEISSVFQEVSYIKIFFIDGMEVLIDPLIGAVYPNNVQSGLCASLNQAIQIVVDQFVENVQSAIFCSVGDQNSSAIKDSNYIGFSKEFYSVLYSFEQISMKNIEKIGIFDKNHREILSFDSIPIKKRSWIGGIWPWQRGFEKLAWDGKVHSLFLDLLNKEIFYKHLKIKEKDEFSFLRGFLVSEYKDSPPVVAVLTNRHDVTADHIIGEYIKRWPNLEQGHVIHLLKTYSFQKKPEGREISDGQRNFEQNFLSKKDLGLFQANNVLLEFINKYCVKRFFPDEAESFDIKTMKTICYNCSGYLQTGKNSITAHLKIEDKEYAPWIQTAAKIVNESFIKNFDRKRVFINLKK